MKQSSQLNQADLLKKDKTQGTTTSNAGYRAPDKAKTPVITNTSVGSKPVAGAKQTVLPINKSTDKEKGRF